MNWLLLRGLAREQRHWGRFTEVFSEAVAPGHVVCLDLPGTGTENGRRSPWSVEAIAADVRARWLVLRDRWLVLRDRWVGLRDHRVALNEGKPGDWGLIAISLGGMAGMSWCERYPEDFQRLVLINSSAANIALPHQRLKLPALARAAFSLRHAEAVQRELAILNITTRMQEAPSSVATEWARIGSETPMEPSTALRQIAAASRFFAPVRLEVATLIVSSLRDEFTDPVCSRRLAERFAAELVCHPRAGHDLPLDDPHWLSCAIRDWSRHCTDQVR